MDVGPSNLRGDKSGGHVVVTAAFLVVCAASFAAFGFDARYAPDYEVQIGYLNYIAGAEPDVLSSLLNNSFVLDVVLWGTQQLTGWNAETTLQVWYVSVFIAKYAVLLSVFPNRHFIVAVFLWSFFSLDVNQLRLNMALMLLLVALKLRRPLLANIVMLAAHLGSIVVLPVTMGRWLQAANRRRALAVAALVAIAATYAVSKFEVTMDERFLDYLDADQAFLPRALLAVPAMFILLRGRFDVWTRYVLRALAASTLVLAAVGLSVASARFVEMIYTVFLLKTGLEDPPLSGAERALLLCPGVLMFASRVVFGVNPSQ